MVADAAIVVCEPETAKALMLAPLFKFLDDRKIPHMLFVNKMDTANYRVREVLAALQTVSARPLVLRQVPMRSTDSAGRRSSPAMSIWSASAPMATSRASPPT